MKKTITNLLNCINGPDLIYVFFKINNKKISKIKFRPLKKLLEMSCNFFFIAPKPNPFRAPILKAKLVKLIRLVIKLRMKSSKR